MATVIGIRFKKAGKVYYFDPSDVWPAPGDYAVVETSRGVEMGEVVTGAREVDDAQIVPPLKKVLRLALEEDIRRTEANQLKEKEAFRICQDRIGHYKLEMKLVDVEYTFEGNKIIFYFTANGRVDFRELVKDLASVFKMRIELRQIGVRDEAKMLGGLGSCGRPICCGTFLGDFQPVSIKMAKEQNLSLNPTKISGQCGRLMCCLKYEQDYYETTLKRLPKVGRECVTPDGNGVISEINVIREKVRVRMRMDDGFEIREYPLDQVQKPAHAAQQTPGQPVQLTDEELAARQEARAQKNRGRPKAAAKDEANEAEAAEQKPEKKPRRRILHPKGPKQLNTDQYFDKLSAEKQTPAEEKRRSKDGPRPMYRNKFGKKAENRQKSE
jgi:cell fate regulator YaaT (PSP1 superfamily)